MARECTVPTVQTGPFNVADFEDLARERLEPEVHGYFAGGAGDERTLRDNVTAFSRWWLRPRVLVDVSEVSTKARVLGAEVAMPVLVAPVAFQQLAHEGGERAMARAAEAAGTAMCLSTLATVRPAELASAAPSGHHWLQLYCFRDREITRGLAAEARESGFEALVLTVDGPYAGRRERDLRLGFEVPAELGVPALTAAVGTRSLSMREVFALVDPALTWSSVEDLASEFDLPVILKGVMTAEDAVLAVEHGAAGVMVSNHGGRQLDGVPASIDALPEVAEAIDGRIAVLMDGGIRRGTDVVVALALGADAVLVGRPAVWGLAVAGEEGARRVLELLRTELQLALALVGCPAPDAIVRAHVRRATG
jgi:isopentenyl diphosphate isomerase/L-lactate dehydrogenase-like FMN-dependent dehydrogenase